MEYHELFAHIWRNYRDYLSRSCGKSIKKDVAFHRITQLPVTNRKETAQVYISRWLNPDETTDSAIIDAFSNPDNRDLVIKTFKLPDGVFDADSFSRLDGILEAAGIEPDTPSDNHPAVSVHIDLPVKSTPLEFGLAEERAFALLVERICEADDILLEWSIPFQTGAAYVVEQLAGSPQIAQRISKLAYLYIDATKTDGKSEVAFLGHKLGLDARDRGDFRKLAVAICEQNVLVVVFGASQFLERAKRRSPLRLLIEAVHAKKTSIRRPHILLVSNQQTTYGVDNRQLDELTTALVVPPEERLPFFKVQLKRFLDEREVERDLGDDDPRLKQVRWHYDQVANIEIWPASIRLRAFFASNLKNESYFDPTQGFKRLAAMDVDHLPDIKSLIHETVTFFNCICEGRNEDDGPIARFLRRNSTALYWLTESAIDYVDKNATQPAESGKTKKVIIGINTEECAALAVRTPYKQLLQPASYGRHEQRGYAMPLGVKAIIQDLWMESDDSTVYRRAWVHYLIAKRMYEERYDIPIEDELPFEAGRLGRDLFFLTEVIRHLMRACGTPLPSPPEGLGQRWRSMSKDNAPKTLEVDAPNRNQRGCDPHEAWSFARNVVYRYLLDGNSRELSRRHGAYSLKVELLQLLSGDGVLGRRHPGMTEKDHVRFLTEVGFALLDVGRLPESADAFEEVASKAREIDNPELLCKSLINKALALATMGLFKEANDALSESGKNLARIQDAPDIYQKNKERLESRTAQIAYLQGHDTKAIRIYQSLEKEAERPVITRDRALTYIFALARRDHRARGKKNPDDLYKAFALSLSNLAHSSSQANYHEVLGFEIALARLHRPTNPMAAEACLDQAYLDILRDGCSERIYLTFLLEAGAVMIANGRPSRAYAAYLEPCFRRLQYRRYFGERKQVVELIRTALENVIKQIDTHSDLPAWRQQLKADIQTPAYLEAAVQPIESDQATEQTRSFDKNPHYSFDLVGVSEWVNRLENRESVQAELEKYQSPIWPT